MAVNSLPHWKLIAGVVLLGCIAAAIPLVATYVLSRNHAIRGEERHLAAAAENSVQHANSLTQDASSALREIGPYSPRDCSQSHIGAMRLLVMSHRSVEEVGFYRDGLRACSSWGITDEVLIIIQGIQNVYPALAGMPTRTLFVRDQMLPASEANDSNIPAWDLSLNYVPVVYPSHTPAVIQTLPGEKELWRVANTAADAILNLQYIVNGTAQPIQVYAVDGYPLSSGGSLSPALTGPKQDAVVRAEPVGIDLCERLPGERRRSSGVAVIAVLAVLCKTSQRGKRQQC